MKQFKGTGVAIVTPFREDGSIDFKCLDKLVNHLIDGKVEYLVVMGTTGESVTLSKDEKNAVVNAVIDTAEGRVPIVLGIGGNSTQSVLNSIAEQDFEGIDAILSVSPYYNKPSQRGIYEHYKMIAGASPVPVILYNVPGRTSSNITAETTLKLAHDFDNIIAVKEASGNLEQCMEIIKNKPKNFLVISGDDTLTLPIIASGGDGVISVTANSFPEDFSEMVRLALKGKMKGARELHYKLFDIMKWHFADGNPGGVKASLNALGICKERVRLPLVPVNEDVRKKIRDLVKNY